MNCTTKEFSIRVKIERARELLKHPDATVQDVAEALRFSSASYFMECFRRETGVSPTKFRSSL